MNEAQEKAEVLFRRANGRSHLVFQMFDEEAQAMQSVQCSKVMLEELLSTGAATLSHYSEQRERLKSAQSKALAVLNTLGLSSSALRLIGRRNRVDTWIKYLGMAITLIILCFLIKWM